MFNAYNQKCIHLQESGPLCSWGSYAGQEKLKYFVIGNERNLRFLLIMGNVDDVIVASKYSNMVFFK